MAHATETTAMTVEEFLCSPLADEEPSWEYHRGGSLRQKLAPSSEHAVVQGDLVRVLLNYVDEHELELEAVPAIRVALPTFSPVPDLAVFRTRFTPGEKYPRQSPILVVEILSPGQSQAGLVEKVREMLAEGTEDGLVVDPRRREVLRVQPQWTQVLVGDEPIPFSAPELARLKLTPARVFARLR